MTVVSSHNRTRRAQGRPTLLKTSQVVLACGAVLSLAAAFGPVWVVRAGVALAILAGVAALVLAAREIRRRQFRAEREKAEIVRGQAAAVSSERRESAKVLQSMNDYNERADQRVNELRNSIDDLRTQLHALVGENGRLAGDLSALRGDNAALKIALGDRDSELMAVRSDLATREAELTALQGDLQGAEAEVLDLPRRAAVDGDGYGDGAGDWDDIPTAEELWADGNHPTVVDLQKLVFPDFSAEPRKHA